MARGFESKSVESQQADREVPADKAGPMSPHEAARLVRLRTLELSKARAVADLANAVSPAHRAMLEAAIADLDAQIRDHAKR